ncbi:MAG: hypothetical protein IJ065_08480 [Eubacterium sp.]|nr:hypothetical protein [Eubacterium sp.]
MIEPLADNQYIIWEYMDEEFVDMILSSNNINKTLMSVLGRHILEFVLPNGKHVAYGSVLQAYFMLLLIASFVITLVVHKKKSLKVTDWIG